MPTANPFVRAAAEAEAARFALAAADDFAGLHAELYVCDLSSAFRFTAIQILTEH